MARTFNGTSDSIALSTASLSASGGPWTISLWANIPSLAGADQYFYTETGASETSIIFEFVDNVVEFYSPTATGTDPRTGSQMTIGAIGWHHIVYRKAAAGASEYAFFLDGTKTVISASVSFAFPVATAAILGKSSGGSFFSGSLADFTIWNVGLSDNEVGLLYAGTPPLSIRPPVRYLPLRGIESPEPDFSTTHINGTLTGTTAADPPSHINYPALGRNPLIINYASTKLLVGDSYIKTIRWVSEGSTAGDNAILTDKWDNVIISESALGANYDKEISVERWVSGVKCSTINSGKVYVEFG